MFRSPSRDHLIVALTTSVFAGLLIWWLSQQMGDARPAAERTACRNNLHSIGIALKGFIERNGDLPRGRNGEFSLMPLLAGAPPSIDADGMVCPSLGSGDAASLDEIYAVNRSLNLKQMEHDPPIPIVYDSTDAHALQNDEDARNVLLSDGHVMFWLGRSGEFDNWLEGHTVDPQPTQTDSNDRPRHAEEADAAPKNPASDGSASIEKPTSVITNTVGMKLALVPAGEFLMGSPDSDELAKPNEKPQHRVRITKPFRLGVYEVTQSEWTAVMETAPWKLQIDRNEGARYPATYVNWEDATEFCRKLTDREGAAGLLEPGESYRLPTEAEWEHACRAGTTTRYQFGDRDGSLGKYAWYAANTIDVGESFAREVGRKRPNAWGLFDMHGNVMEWCMDPYGQKYYAKSPFADPVGPARGSGRVIRGGCWIADASSSRSSFRSGNGPHGHYGILGFRVARGSG